MIPHPISGQLIEAQDLNSDIKRLKDSANLIKDSLKGNDPKIVEDVAKQFEEIFIFYMLKTMRATVQKSGLIDGGRAEEIYTSMLDQKISEEISKRGGIGLSDLLISDLTKRGYLKEYEKGEMQGLGKLGLPATGEISSSFGMRNDPIDGTKRFHHGIDIADSYGSKIRAASSGRVVFSGEKGNYGNAVVIMHKGGLSTLYAHNSKNLVKTGDYVKRGQPIALIGDSGRSTGPHLHFEVRRNGEPLDPSRFL